MARYDWRYGRGGMGGSGRMGGGYGGEYSSWGEAWSGGQGGGFRGRPRGFGYDRGVYGSGYPSYGGYPGGRESGMYYGGGGGYAGGDRGWEQGMGGRGGYDGGLRREPFLPEDAYRRHPELAREPGRHRGPWSSGMHETGALGAEADDDEIRQAVRQSLHQDSWIRPDRVEVEVSGGVVTLTGEVEDYMQARYAWDDAWETAGVRGVINNLTVKTG